MAGPRPEDPYNPVPTVEPQTGMPADYLNQKATPGSFGAPVGQATSQLGQTFGKMGDQAMSLAIERQGQINESMATAADTSNAISRGEIYGQYKTLTGAAAVQAAPGVVNQVQALWQKNRDSLSNDAARRAYDQMTLKQHAYIITDINTYAAGQVKEMATQTAVASADNAVQSLSNPAIAFNSSLRSAALGDAKFGSLHAAQNKYGFGSEVHIDGKTGAITFDDTPQGNNSKALWDNYWNDIQEKAWTNIINTVAYDKTQGNISKAVDLLTANKDSMPGSTYAKLSHALTQPYNNYLAYSMADHWIQSDLGSPTGTEDRSAIQGTAHGDLHAAVLGQESTNNSNVPDSVTGAHGPGQIEPGTWDGAVKQGIIPSNLNFNNPTDNRKGSALLLDHYMQEYHGDYKRASVAYFSGEGNVAPAGSAVPWINDSHDPNGKYVSSYVGDVTARMGDQQPVYPGGPTGGRGYLSPGAKLSHNAQVNYDQHRAELLSDPQMGEYFRNNPQELDNVMGRYLNQVAVRVKLEHDQVDGAKQTIMSYINDQAAHNQPVQDVAQLYYAPGGVGDAMKIVDANDSLWGASLAGRIIPSMGQHMAPTWGSIFDQAYEGVMTGSIKDEKELADYLNHNVGVKDQPLTNSGYKTLVGIMGQLKDPKTRSQVQGTFNVLYSPQVRGRITGTGSAPGVYQPERDEDYRKFLMEVIPQLAAVHGDPKKEQAIIDAGIVKYGNNLKKDLAGIYSSTLTSPSAAPAPATSTGTSKPFDVNQIKDWDSLVTAVKNKQVDRNTFNRLIQSGQVKPPAQGADQNFGIPTPQ